MSLNSIGKPVVRRGTPIIDNFQKQPVRNPFREINGGARSGRQAGRWQLTLLILDMMRCQKAAGHFYGARDTSGVVT